VTLSNGRGPVDYEDYGDDKAVGGRLYAKTDALGSLTIGTSYYRGGYYDRKAKYVLTTQRGNTGVDQQFNPISKYQEFSFGADLKWEWDFWLVQGEFLMNDAHFARGARPPAQVLKPPLGFAADYRRWGYYALAGYRIRKLLLMPYVLLQHAEAPDQPNTPPCTAYEE